MVPKVAICDTASRPYRSFTCWITGRAFLAEVDIEVGHRDPFRVQETLEQQVVLQRVEVGNLQRIRHQRTGAGTPARADRHAVVLGPLDKVGHDQEVAREPILMMVLFSNSRRAS
jgi:hypothetical protein